ncbi:MAG: imidazole glycerol phosphate synthase subunit HisF, partial [Candidatus Bathyarchaeia archaeon]
TVGGGIRTLKDMETTLRAGADKVSINTAAVRNPDLIRQGAEKFGSQCIVVAIDGKRVKPSVWEVYVMGGRVPTDIDALEWVTRAERLGAGEILLTSVDADGTRAGYDMDFTRMVCENVNIPVIASGGAGKLEHIFDVLTKGKADAALAASIFHYGQHRVRDLKRYLLERDVPVRLQA